MPLKSGYDHHANLVDRMADTLGLDLRREMERAKISYQQLDGAVVRCMDCPPTPRGLRAVDGKPCRRGGHPCAGHLPQQGAA